MTLDEWTEKLSSALGVDPDVEIPAILDLARDAAHQIDRPAAPLTTFIVGYAAGVRGGSTEDVADCIDIAVDLIDTD
jgi:hypothetical protein